MKILILNWRDINNPEHGGAEVLTHEMAKRWVKSGHEVTQFSAKFSGGYSEETKDGIKIIRQGSANIRSLDMPVHIAAYLWYRRQSKGCFDIIIDEIHGIPFFTPWYVQEKKIALICEVANTIWNAAFSFPFNIIGQNIERSYFHFYKDILFLTISPSTKTDLLQMGVKEQNITVLPMGLSISKGVHGYPKEKDFTLIFVARLTKAKGIQDTLHVIAHLYKIYPKIHLWVVGQGDSDYVKEVTNLAQQLKVKDYVKFFGFVNQEKKFELMSRAHLLIAPSVKEGWGLTVPEAGYVGTPTIAYNVEGLRDVIVQDKTGLLTQTTPEQMSQMIIKLLRDKHMYQKIQMGAQKLAKTYSWDQTAKVALSKLQLT